MILAALLVQMMTHDARGCIMLCVINTKQNTQSPEFLVEKEHSPLENSPGHGNAQIGVFRHQGAFWAEDFVFLSHMGLIIFQAPYPEKVINEIGAHECPWGSWQELQTEN